LVDSSRQVCIWRCLACEAEARGSQEPPQCECGLERSWVVEGSSAAKGASVLASELERVELPRLRTGARELDQLLGGGPARGSTVLIYGKRGTGKSRLTYRFASAYRCLVVHPEMALEVARHVAESTGATLERVHLQAELEGWQAEASRVRARAVVIDSLAAADDQVSELRASQRWARRSSSVVYCIAHATKAGDHRGSTELAHWADYEWRLKPHEAGVELEVRKTRLEPCGAVVLSLA